MARYRFSWENLPTGLLRSLADSNELAGPPAAALRSTYGARPRVGFVGDNWAVLLERWLPRARSARVTIVEELRNKKLGSWTAETKSADDQLAYLRTCRNSAALREAVLTQLILAGEADRAPVPKSKSVPAESPAPRVDTGDAPQDAGGPSLPDFVDATLRAHLEVTELQRDDDGDIPIRSGTSMCFVRVVEQKDQPARVTFFVPLAIDVKVTPELLESLNEINKQLSLGRVMVNDGTVVLESELLADTLGAQELLWALDLMTDAGTYFDKKLVARYGGRTFFEETGAPVDV